MRRLTRLRAGLAVCALTAASLIGVSPSQAFPTIQESFFTGYSNTNFPSVSFALLGPNSPFLPTLAANFSAGQGSPSTSLDAGKFTYLYQVANNLERPNTIRDFFLPVSVATGGDRSKGVVTSFGTYDRGNFRLDFVDKGTIIGAGGGTAQNCGLGSRCPSDGPGGNLDGASFLGIAGRTVSGNDLVNVLASTNPNSKGISYAFQFPASNGIANGKTSPLFGFQSDVLPGVGNGIITGSNSDGSSFSRSVFGIPSVGPEPGTVLLLGSGLVGLVAWRRKQQIKSATN